MGGVLVYIIQSVVYSIDETLTFRFGLGASAGVSALLACAALVIPEEKVKVFFIEFKTKTLALVFFAAEIILFAIGNTTTDHTAHLIGGLIGLFYTKLFIKKVEDNGGRTK